MLVPQCMWEGQRMAFVSFVILSFHHVSPNDRTQVLRLGDKCPYLLSHLTHWPRVICLFGFCCCF